LLQLHRHVKGINEVFFTYAEEALKAGNLETSQFLLESGLKWDKISAD